jgi:hypothetical protein
MGADKAGDRSAAGTVQWQGELKPQRASLVRSLGTSARFHHLWCENHSRHPSAILQAGFGGVFRSQPTSDPTCYGIRRTQSS